NLCTRGGTNPPHPQYSAASCGVLNQGIHNKDELEGSDDFEFLPGKFQGEWRNDNSVFMYESSVVFIEDLLEKNHNEFDHWGVTYYNTEQLDMLEYELSKRLIEIRENKEISIKYINEIYCRSLNKKIKIFRNDILKMFDELISWIKLNKENGITVLGP
ncbi:MAG: hypothetical protein LBU84_00760, partial [Prevotella sp.]|nr:hypothetical protein [Prevotella sp.]